MDALVAEGLILDRHYGNLYFFKISRRLVLSMRADVVVLDTVVDDNVADVALVVIYIYIYSSSSPPSSSFSLFRAISIMISYKFTNTVRQHGQVLSAADSPFM